MRKRLLKVTAAMLLAGCASVSAEQIDHFIMDGQSLSTGHQSWPALSTENVAGNFMLGDQIWSNYGHGNDWSLQPLIGGVCNELNYPAHTGSRQAASIAECPLLGAVNHLQLKYGGNKILATSVGVSGATVEELSKECDYRSYYKNFETLVKYAKENATRSGYTINCPAIFWMQGEFNYIIKSDPCGLHKGENNTTAKKEYKALMLRLKDNMQSHITATYGQSEKPLWVTYQTGAQYTRDKLGIGMAQLEAANEYDDIIMAGPVYQMPDRGGHLDANGYRWYGEILAKAYHQGKSFQPLQPKRITREDGGKKVRVKFLVPVAPLVFDTDILPEINNYGFNVYHNGYGDGARQTIKSIAIEGDDVVMTFDTPLTGDIYVTYAAQNATIKTPVAGKNNLSGHGNLRDSDPYKSELVYIDLDGKEGDRYIYARNDDETTLRPDFEPCDASGSPIYGKPYPLYNFAVAFYYKLSRKSDTLEILDENNKPLPSDEREEGTLATAYVDAANGSDNNDGTTASTAFATLAKAASSIKFQDATIRIAGTITVDDEIDLSDQKSLTIEGIGADAAIKGTGKNRLAETEGMSLTVKNLTLSGFHAAASGGVFLINSGDFTADKVTFDNNSVSGVLGNLGGAVCVSGGNVTLSYCDFTGNKAYSGGAMAITNGDFIASYCNFDNNMCIVDADVENKSEARGGAIYVCGVKATFNNCSLTANKSVDSGGAVLVKYSHKSNLYLTFNGCAILDNYAGEHSGAVFGWNNVDPDFAFNFVNCTISGNTAKQCGGVAWMLNNPANQSLNIYNCTVVNNHSESGSWHTGAFRLFDAKLKTTIVNSIIENNTGGNDHQYSDLHITGYSTDNAANTVIRHSVIGKFITADKCTLTTLQTDEYSQAGYAPHNRAQGEVNFAGLGNLTDNTYYPFASEKAKGIGMGDDNLLYSKFNVTTDQLGNIRKNNTIGSIDNIAGTTALNDIETDTMPTIKRSGNTIHISSSQSDTIATCELYTSSGLKVKAKTISLPTQISIDNLTAGIYLLRVMTDNGKTVIKLTK